MFFPLAHLFRKIRTSELVLLARASMAEPKILAEYAKSNRSSCKTCSKNIPAGSLRLGFSIKDPRGFDAVKWNHLDCFSMKFHSLGKPEEITGFSSLKSSDQDALRKLEIESSLNQSINGGNRKEIEQFDEMEMKKRKLSAAESEEKLGVKISLSYAKNMYKDAILPPKWKAFETIIFNEQEGLRNTEKIAAFDFDGCLANTSVKRIGADAWSLMYPSIPEKLQELYNGDHKLVIFTNESNIERWKNKRQQAVDSKIGRIDQFIKLVKAPIQVFIACGFGNIKKQIEDPFRKPGTGMWQILVEKFNSGIAIDMDQSFYVGDAAGRASDHSDADIKFAQAIGLKFYVPEEFFGA